MVDKVKILEESSIQARLRRMAFEIYEKNYLEDSLIVIGIDERGGFLAKKITAYLHEISPLDIELVSANLDRSEAAPDIGIDLSVDIESLQEKTVVVVDDVLYSGTTMLNVVAILLQARPSQIQPVVLIDRGHRKMPITPTIVGMELATTLHQHVSVEIEPESGKVEAFLL